MLGCLILYDKLRIECFASSILEVIVLDSLIQFFITYGYFAVFGVLLISGFGFPLPEDITLVAGGFISSLACPVDMTFWPALQTCHQVHVMFGVAMAGVLIGDSTMFLIGRIYGQRVLNIKIFSKIITPKRYQWAEEMFEKYGTYFVFAARFMPGLRSPIFMVTGITRKVSFLKFFLTDGFAAIISVPVWIYLGFWGERQLSDMKALEHYVKRGQLTVFIIIGLVIVGISSYFIIKSKIKKRYNYK
jgi:membrane protein DedA with SNARE-associated domain